MQCCLGVIRPLFQRYPSIARALSGRACTLLLAWPAGYTFTYLGRPAPTQQLGRPAG